MYNNNDNNKNQFQKFPGKTFFVGFQLTVSKNKGTFMKKAVLHYNHFDALRHGLRGIFSANQGNGSKITCGSY